MPDLEDFPSSPEKCFAALLGSILLISKASMLATMVTVILVFQERNEKEKVLEDLRKAHITQNGFLLSQIYPKKYWIGLFFDIREKRWKWMDAGRSSGITIAIMNKLPTGGKCAILTPTIISSMFCDNAYSCVCEKRMDATFPASVCRKEERGRRVPLGLQDEFVTLLPGMYPTVLVVGGAWSLRVAEDGCGAFQDSPGLCCECNFVAPAFNTHPTSTAPSPCWHKLSDIPPPSPGLPGTDLLKRLA
ncbi:uncharacterized protein LOC100723924 isoform X4 [Cavia porcellus]|uniref:uncharacterized protein LOC100723924 isoform X4 n=1 Tax=Cavia porcellus TaxID=10141 RepID=UPI002FE2BFB2